VSRSFTALLVALMWLWPLAAPAEVPLHDPALETRAQALFRELRCVVCQGESLAESQAEIASDIRAEIRQHLKDGEQEQQILDLLVSRYGEFILMTPPLRVATLLLWFGPLLALLAGIWLAAAYFRKAGTQA
jgi:cytochrome c-type biogenesis protein CcmH